MHFLMSRLSVLTHTGTSPPLNWGKARQTYKGFKIRVFCNSNKFSALACYLLMRMRTFGVDLTFPDWITWVTADGKDVWQWVNHTVFPGGKFCEERGLLGVGWMRKVCQKMQGGNSPARFLCARFFFQLPAFLKGNQVPPAGWMAGLPIHSFKEKKIQHWNLSTSRAVILYEKVKILLNLEGLPFG